MYDKPFITVLMPVYNCQKYVFEAVQSILTQTYNHFELLIIDDCSTDSTLKICKSFQDERIKIIEKKLNTGYTNSLNYGIKIAKGKYIARMDGDDISLPKRFEKQINLLEANSDIALCGTLISIIGTNNIINLPENHIEIKLALLKGNCIAHPSIMIRKDIIDNLAFVYDIAKEPAEDYDLWVRLIAFTKLHNLKEVLIQYRIHNTQVSNKREEHQKESALQSRLKLFSYLNYSFNNNEDDLLMKILKDDLIVTFNEIKDFVILKNKMLLANTNDVFEKNGFSEYLNALQKQTFKDYFIKRKSFNPLICFQYFQSRKKFEIKLNTIDEFKLIVKSIIFYD